MDLAITVNISFLFLLSNFSVPVYLNIHETKEQKNGTDISQTIWFVAQKEVDTFLGSLYLFVKWMYALIFINKKIKVNYPNFLTNFSG